MGSQSRGKQEDFVYESTQSNIEIQSQNFKSMSESFQKSGCLALCGQDI